MTTGRLALDHLDVIFDRYAFLQGATKMAVFLHERNAALGSIKITFAYGDLTRNLDARDAIALTIKPGSRRSLKP